MPEPQLSSDKSRLREVLAGYASQYKDWPFSHVTLPGLGDVSFRFYKQARSLKAFWRQDKLVVTIPYHISFSIVANFLIDRYEAILKNRPGEFAVGPGFEYTFPDGDRILFGVNDSIRPNHVGCTLSRPNGPEGPAVYTLVISSLEEYDSTRFADPIRGMLKNILMHKASWMSRVFKDVCGRTDILSLTGRGMLGKPFFGLSTMGKCTAKGVITLSTALVLYPLWFREYIVCHELAHLSHHDHSPAFHAECERLLNLNFRSRLPKGMLSYAYKSPTLEKAFIAYHKTFTLPLPLR